MLKLTFSVIEIAELNYERYHHPHPRVQKKMEVLYLKSQQVRHQEICRLCQISRTTLSEYLKAYQEYGISGLKQRHYRGQPSQLNQHQSTLESEFREHPPASILEAQTTIEKLTGIRRSPTQVRAFLQRIGMKRRKVGFVSGKSVSPEKLIEQQTFEIEQLQPRLAEVADGKRTLFL